MDLSTLSQQLNMSVQELRSKMREAGFRVSLKARKVDNSLARDIYKKLSGQAPEPEARPEKITKISVPPFITVKDLADKLREPVTAVIKKLIQNGVMATINEEIDTDTASIIAAEYGVEVEAESPGRGLETARASVGFVADIIAREDSQTLVIRAPVVAVMGHVDHEVAGAALVEERREPFAREPVELVDVH